ncbi:MAG: hypothetical protein JW723_10040 [Bacteroidales bacterium]|nr:hypothetical protein [Bacteroidales bacterium]
MIFRDIKLAVLFILTCVPSNVYSQLSLTGYLEGGKNAVYNNYYLSCSALPSCEIRDFKLESGFSWTFADQKENRFEGCFIRTSKDVFLFKSNAIGLAGFYLWKPFSFELREVNWGVLTTLTTGHFQFLLGNNHRTYRYSDKSRNLNEFSGESLKITEPWNLVYEVRYALNNNDKPWNLAAALTNIDYFLINQETNPMFHLLATYSVFGHTDMFLDIWYKNAGMFNMKVNYFGYFIRLGLQWKITH